jgi:hypothetical protein
MIGKYACAVIVASGAIALSYPAAAFAAQPQPETLPGRGVPNAPTGQENGQGSGPESGQGSGPESGQGSGPESGQGEQMGGPTESVRPEGPAEPPPTPASVQGAGSQQRPERPEEQVRSSAGKKKSKKKKKNEYNSSIIIRRNYTSNVHNTENGEETGRGADPSEGEEGQGDRGRTGHPAADKLLAELGM